MKGAKTVLVDRILTQLNHSTLEPAEQKSSSQCFAPSLNHFRGQTSVDLQLIDWKGE